MGKNHTAEFKQEAHVVPGLSAGVNLLQRGEVIGKVVVEKFEQAGL